MKDVYKIIILHLLLIVFCSPNFAVSQQISEFIHVDQFGYFNNAEKVAVISNPQIGYNSNLSYNPGQTFQVRDLFTEAIIYSSSVQLWNGGNTHAQSGDQGWWFDFSSVTSSGSYYIYDPSTGHRSAPFEINANPYSEVIKAATKTFYYNRCGIEKVTPFAQQIWNDDESFLQDYNARNAYDQSNAATERDMYGGWFDAGDYNKYVTFAHDPIHQLLTSFEENPSIYTDDWNIPESGDGVPDILNEIKWELDWLLKMINADGSVYIKMGSLNYDINANAPPSANTEPRYYGYTCPSASLSVASIFAHAAKVFKDYPSLVTYANALEQDAILCWNYFLPFYDADNLQTDCDDQVVKSGDADWSEIVQINNAVIGATYLFDLTTNLNYSNFVANNINEIEPIVNDYWAAKHPILLEAVLFYTTLNNADQSAVNTILNSTSNAVLNNWGNFFDFSADDLYRAQVPDWIYYWGSNMGKANIGNICNTMIKYNVVPSANAGLTRKAAEQLHYFHGINPLGIVYLSNMYQYGADRSVNRIFHTWFNYQTDWDDALNSIYGPAPGFLAGGPNQGYTGALTPPANQPLQKCFLDYNNGYSDVAYEITEPAIYYQAAYIRMLANFVNTQTITSSVDISATNNCIEIFPNPTNNFLQIRGNLEAYTVQVLNANGFVYQTLNTNSGELVINLSDYPSGMFFIKIWNQNNNLLSVEKFLKTN